MDGSASVGSHWRLPTLRTLDGGGTGLLSHTRTTPGADLPRGLESLSGPLFPRRHAPDLSPACTQPRDAHAPGKSLRQSASHLRIRIHRIVGTTLYSVQIPVRFFLPDMCGAVVDSHIYIHTHTDTDTCWPLYPFPVNSLIQYSSLSTRRNSSSYTGTITLRSSSTAGTVTSPNPRREFSLSS